MQLVSISLLASALLGAVSAQYVVKAKDRYIGVMVDFPLNSCKKVESPFDSLEAPKKTTCTLYFDNDCISKYYYAPKVLQPNRPSELGGDGWADHWMKCVPS